MNCWMVGTALMGGLAALGYWVLRTAMKDKGAMRLLGQVIGWVLIVAGLLGFACGITSHMADPGGSGKQSISMSMDLPP